jgi:small subunit ribosomal protein S6
MFIVNPSVVEEDIDKINTQIESIITAGGGTVAKVEKMGKRRLAYPVNKNRDGFYVLLTIQATGEIVKETERRLRVMDSVIKYLTVRMDEDIGARKRSKRIARNGHCGAAPMPALPTVPLRNNP